MFETYKNQLETQGYFIAPDFLSAKEVDAQRQEIERLRSIGSFQAARIGRGEKTQLQTQIRGDETCWLEPAQLSPTQSTLWNKMEALRCLINEKLLLGLFELEAHYAIYSPGSSYEKHLDRFQSDNKRVLSIILYLNENWKKEDGGELRLEIPETQKTLDVLPTGGTLVAFLSDKFPHEVRPTHRERFSFTGWFKQRG